LQAFTADEFARAKLLLATRVATMMGRKLEESDWSSAYCRAKNIPCTGWSNLSIDVAHGSLGVEHKMLCVKSKPAIRDYCGTTLMHPAATRSIRIPLKEKNATKAARDILRQYGQLISDRTAKVKEASDGRDPDMRTGWLLWEESLREFMYFEERMSPPNPEDFTATWNEKAAGSGLRKGSRNLWVFERATGRKRYSITTSAGAKIQPYFDVPPPTDPNLYVFTVQGEVLEDGYVRLWITPSTAVLLRSTLGSLDTAVLTEAILEAAKSAPPPVDITPAD